MEGAPARLTKDIEIFMMKEDLYNEKDHGCLFVGLFSGLRMFAPVRPGRE
jgi:hypothetical protein